MYMRIYMCVFVLMLLSISLCDSEFHIHYLICMVMRQKKCFSSATYSVLFGNFVHLVDLNEFLFSYGYMIKFYIVCLMLA